MINGLIKLFYSEVVKSNIKKMPRGEYSLKDEYKEIKNLTFKIDNLVLKFIKIMLAFIILILSFEVNIILGIGIFLMEFLYIIYKKSLEDYVLNKIKYFKDNIKLPTLYMLSEKGKSGINILIIFLILGIITKFNWSIVLSFTVVFLFTIKDIYSNIK